MLKADDVLPFIRGRNYQFVRFLGQGGTGQTALIWDDILEIHLVVKKYSPFYPEHAEQFFENFIREIKLMYQVYHKNVVRIHHCLPFPPKNTGFILMEHVNGGNIREYIQSNPEKIDHVFVQLVEGFAYLEQIGVLHRDIRMDNIMVDVDGTVKIIDFGFGKRIEFNEDFDKSITLNWAASSPKEFLKKRYDFCTEVYFLGKLVEELVTISADFLFSHNEILLKMIEHNPDNRYDSFSSVNRAIDEGIFSKIDFSYDDFLAYQSMADFLSGYISKMSTNMNYVSDPDLIIKKLTEVYHSSILEEYVQAANKIVWCFLSGGQYYHDRNFRCSPETVKDFLRFFESQTNDRKGIVLSNMWARLDQITRYEIKNDDDIPF